MRARKGTRKQKTQPGAAATTHYRFRISWVLLILLLLLALIAIALPGHARVTGRTLNAVARHVIRFPLTDDSGEGSSTATAPSLSQLMADATVSRVCFGHVEAVELAVSLAVLALGIARILQVNACSDDYCAVRPSQVYLNVNGGFGTPVFLTIF